MTVATCPVVEAGFSGGKRSVATGQSCQFVRHPALVSPVAALCLPPAKFRRPFWALVFRSGQLVAGVFLRFDRAILFPACKLNPARHTHAEQQALQPTQYYLSSFAEMPFSKE